MWYGLATADWIVLAAYLIGITVIGVWSFRRVKGMDDFFMGGRRFGKVFMMFFAFGAGTSSEQAVSVVAGTFRTGLAGIWYQFLWLWATPFYWILAPVFRRMRAFTTSDYFEHRFNTSAATLYSVYGIAMSIVFIAAGLFGSGKMIQGLTGGELDYNYAVAAMTVMFVTYGLAGGLGAAIVTDFIQGILTITLSFLLLPFAFEQIGGFAGLHTVNETVAAFRPNMLDLFLPAGESKELAIAMGQPPITIFYVFMLSVTALAGIVVQPHIMGVCGAGKTEFEGRFGFTFGNFIKRFCTVAWTFTGLACILIYLTPERAAEFAANPDAEKEFADQMFGLAAHDILPTIAPGLVGLLLASLLAAVMSTCDAQMIVSSGLFTENIYKRFLKKGQSQKHYVMVGRIAGLVIVAFALILQTQFTDVIHALKIIIKTPAAIGIAFWLGIMWRGFTPIAVFTSTFSAFGTWFFLTREMGIRFVASLFPWMVAGEGDAAHVFDAWVMFGYMGVGVLVGILTSFVTPRTPKEKLDHFYRLIRTPAREGEKIEQACVIPVDAAPPDESKLINHPDWEIPKPSLLGLGGFVAAWVMVGLIILLTKWLAGLGAPQ
jgi:Na+/proline symporter